MTQTLKQFERENPLICLTTEADCICSHCPNRRGSGCTAIEKVARYDEKVLALCQLQPGCTLPWRTFCDLVKTRILVPGKLKQICGDCGWNCGDDGCR